MVGLQGLNFIHELFLLYLRAGFRNIGYLVGRHPWKVVVFVHVLTLFGFY